MLRFFLLLAILSGMALRVLLINEFPFREDESVYSYWAHHFLNEDPLFLTVWPDKPPIFIWLLSGAFSLLGVGEFSARAVSISASVATIPVVAATANRLWGSSAALFSAAAMALNPLAISFAPTAYTDSVLILWGALALYAVLVGRSLWAGIFLGLAIMTKQQGVLYTPLIVWMLVCSPGNNQRATRFVVGVGLILLPLLAGDSLRWAVAPSPWDLSVRNYGALALLPPGEWIHRLGQWAGLGWYLVGSAVGWILLMVGGIVSAFFALKGEQWGGREAVGWGRKGAPLLWAIGFVMLHVVTSVQVWDRYFLPLAPMLALVVGWIGTSLAHRLSMGRRWTVILLSMVLILVYLPPSWRAANGQLPIGGDHGDLAGLHEVLAWIQSEQGDEPFVLYHQALGPQYRFYYYDEVERGQADLRWYPHETYLIDNAVKVPHRRKFLIQPDWASANRLDIQAEVRQVGIWPIGRFGRFQLSELVYQQTDCEWCVCRALWPPSIFLGGR